MKVLIVAIVLILAAFLLWDHYRPKGPADNPDAVAPAATEEADPPKPKGWAKWSDEPAAPVQSPDAKPEAGTD